MKTYASLLAMWLVVVTAGCSSREFESRIAPERGTGTPAAQARVPSPTSSETATPAREITPTAASTSTRQPAVAPTPTTVPTRTPAPTPEPTPMRTPPPGPLAGRDLVTALRSGGDIIYFRHAATDPIPDDAVPVVLADCATQRNLSTAGRAQATTIGENIVRLGISIGDVLSSPFCRAIDTAQLAFGKATIEPALENIETVKSEADRNQRISGLRRLLSDRPSGAWNRVLVAHGVNISGAGGGEQWACSIILAQSSWPL